MFTLLIITVERESHAGLGVDAQLGALNRCRPTGDPTPSMSWTGGDLRTASVRSTPGYRGAL